MYKLPKILSLLLAPFLLYAGEDGGGGADDKVDRGDTLDAGRPDPKAEEDVDAEATKIAAEAAAKEKEGEEGEEGDEDGEEKSGKDDKKTRKDTRIPLSRHKELLEKERERRAAVEQELAKFKKGEEVVKVNEEIEKSENKLLDLEKQYTKLISDGEAEKAAAMMKEIRGLERSIIEQKGAMTAAAAEARAYERVRFDMVVERLEAAYPALDPEHEDYDREQVKEVLELQEAYELKGYAPADALQKAARIMLGTETKKQETATTVDPKVKAEDVAKERAKEARKKAVDASGKQPADTSKTGIDSDKVGGGLTADKVMLMSQDEFAKLDEKELARMRGDDL